MKGTLFYGLKGRIISGFAAAGAVSSAILFSLQQANVFSLVPAKYVWVQGVVTVALTFITLFSERLQGGASSPQVRHDAAEADAQNAAIDPPDQQGGGG